MRILAFDTATSACSAALWEDGRSIARRFETMPRGQAEHLIPMVLDVMTEAGAGFPDLDVLAVTNGPGAFTGLRIGLATARGMALAGNLPCLGVTTLDVVAAQVPAAERKDRKLLVVLDSKRADVYAQAFAADLSPLSEPRALLPDDLPGLAVGGAGGKGAVVVAGDALARGVKALEEAGVDVVASTAPGIPDAATVATLAAERWPEDGEAAPPRPLYLRPPDAKALKNGGRLRP